ncbi:kelch repeat protein [Colletotrichum graminicola]|uniref:Kelch repeat protein n=1 Tax=Colletotrichum graminicola (strain M1.001 / M2 / FGSC 10212) TaxID=645133 RepID=E3Q843_COLGM|nr:kelch repeat protein [Colletotrichum graminicola M1.001]EFQ27055.1 kelch repeat protein [Colletotrichum graminicola M1.001]WDK16799.1 kelch repeat protein [Colletotrichum graminicola]
MVSRGWLVALFAAAHLSPVCSADDADDAGALDVPPVANFLRRVFARSSVIGNWAYFDGGEVSQHIGNGQNTSRPSSPLSSTLSIDLSKSWKPADVEIKQTQKFAPKMNRQAVFTDASSNSFYIWGGHTSYLADPPSPRLWKFSADGSGGGSWSTEIKPGHDLFTRLTRSQGAAYVSTPDSGFYFGGFSSGSADPNPKGPVPGFLEFNYTATDQAWKNHTVAPYSTSGNVVGASAHYVPSFGPNGIVMMFGGASHVIGAGQSNSNVGWLGFDTIYVMEPLSKRWYSQKTSGNAPGARMWHCTAGAVSQNNTYEIFVFGGSNTANKETYDEVYVLSLPGFVWIKADYAPSSPRDCMSCVVAGRRQMVTFGGVDRMRWNDNSTNFFRDPDPFPQGVGVFDLTDLKWKDEYDADASSYDSPEAIKAWYNEGNIASVQYSDAVARLMSSGTSGSAFFSGSGSGPDSGSDPGSDPAPGDSGSGSVNAGAIAGGVVGGVAGIALISLAAFYLMRRRKHKRAPAQESGGAVEDPIYPQEMEHSYSPNPPPTSSVAPSELHGEYRDHSPYSMGEVPKMMQPPEMDAQDPRYGHAAELDASETRR